MCITWGTLGGGGNSRDEDLIRNWGELSINPLTEADGRRKCYSSYHPPTSSQKPSQPTCIVSHQPRARKHRAPGISTKHQALGISTSARARRGFKHPQALEHQAPGNTTKPSIRHQHQHQVSASNREAAPASPPSTIPHGTRSSSLARPPARPNPHPQPPPQPDRSTSTIRTWRCGELEALFLPIRQMIEKKRKKTIRIVRDLYLIFGHEAFYDRGTTFGGKKSESPRQSLPRASWRMVST